MKRIQKNEVLMLSKDFPLEPRFNKIIITLNNVESDNKLQLSETMLSETQFVMAVGPMVTGLKVGDSVLLDVEKMMVSVRVDNGAEINDVKQIKVDPVTVGEYTFAFIEDRVIKAIDNRGEVEIIKL